MIRCCRYDDAIKWCIFLPSTVAISLSKDNKVSIQNTSIEKSITIENPALWFLNVLKSVFDSRGINITGELLVDAQPIDSVDREKTETLFVHQSPILSEIVKETNKDSKNFYAEQIFKTLGAQINKNGSAEVQTKIISPKTEVTLYYRLLKKDGDWLVYDVVINGVSLVKNYRSQFARIIRRSSYQELINTLREKSQEITAP